MAKKLIVVGVGVVGSVIVAGVASGVATARSLWRQWGIAPGEASLPLPGDDLVPDADTADTRGIDIAAAPDAVWPWLVQMGYNRAGWYSYDALDMDHPSASEIVPELQSLEVGDVLPTDPGGGFEVRVIEPGKSLVAYLDRSLVEAQRGEGHGADGQSPGVDAASANVRATSAYLDRAVSGDFAVSWAFVVEPRDGGTRLIERFRARMEPPAPRAGRPRPLPGIARSALGFGVFVMTRRQMLGIRDRVEGRMASGRPSAFRLGLRRGFATPA